MKFVIALIAIISAYVSAEVVNNVVELNATNFWDTIGEHPTMTLFYAPWCGHCKQIKPEWEKAAESATSIGVNFAKIDCDSAENKPICSSFGVKGYPTVKYLNGPIEKMADFNGARTASALVAYAETAEATTPLPTKPAPPAPVVANTKFGTAPIPNQVVELDSSTFMDTISSQNTLVFFYAPWCGHCKKTKPIYEQAASKANEGIAVFANMDCDKAYNKPICTAFNVPGYPTIIYIDAHTKKYVEYSGDRTAADFFKFTYTAKGVTPLPESLKSTSSNFVVRAIENIVDGINKDLNAAFTMRKNVALILVGFGFFLGYFAHVYLSSPAKNKKKRN